MARKKSTRPRSSQASHNHIETQRARLMRASAILVGAALAIEHDVDRDVVADAITAGRDLVDVAVVALDSVNINRAQAQE